MTRTLGFPFTCWFCKVIIFFCFDRDGPLYLEWAPGNILNQTSTVDDDKVVGALDVKKVVLKPQIEDIAEADVDLDPDRIEVILELILILEMHGS